MEDCIHVEAVLSIDEMWAWLPLNLREPEVIQSIAEKIKATVARDVSPVIAQDAPLVLPRRQVGA